MHLPPAGDAPREEAVRGRTYVATPGDEQTGKGSGIYRVWRGSVTRVDATPAVGLVQHAGSLYISSFNRLRRWSSWSDGGFTDRKVIFSRPPAQLAFLEPMAIGPDGRLYVGSTDAGDEGGALGTPLSGRVFSFALDGGDLREHARGLRQPFGIAFRSGDPVPWVGNESDETTPTPPDFIVHAATGSDFGFPACQWQDPAAAACAGKTAPTLTFRAHSSPTGMVARGDTLYVAFFGGTTAKGPEIRAIPASGPSRRIVQSAVPLVGLGLSDGWLYFGDVTGTLYRVRV